MGRGDENKLDEILTAVGTLRAEVTALRVQVDEGFAAVDDKLAYIASKVLSPGEVAAMGKKKKSARTPDGGGASYSGAPMSAKGK